MAQVDYILPALYLGNVLAARSSYVLAKYKITHTVSILHGHASTGPHHLSIALHDSLFEDLLIHLPRICDFIDEAVAGGGVVFVHCEMGISRSATCVIAYVMRKQGLELSLAIQFVRKMREIIRPNSGFIRQLYVFEQCEYALTETHPLYIAWKKANEEAATVNTRTIFVSLKPVDDSPIYITCGTPHNLEEADRRLRQHEITHIVTAASPELVVPKKIGEYSFHTVPMTDRKRHQMFSDLQRDILHSLPNCVQFIQGAIDGGGKVLVHSYDSCTAAGIVCAYLMSRRSMTLSQAVTLLGRLVPWFYCRDDLREQLLLYENCDYQPTQWHPLVIEWMLKVYSED